MTEPNEHVVRHYLLRSIMQWISFAVFFMTILLTCLTAWVYQRVEMARDKRHHDLNCALVLWSQYRTSHGREVQKRLKAKNGVDWTNHDEEGGGGGGGRYCLRPSIRQTRRAPVQLRRAYEAQDAAAAANNRAEAPPLSLKASTSPSFQASTPAAVAFQPSLVNARAIFRRVMQRVDVAGGD
ncbi:hypothetical protein C8J56DRAFT_1029891 [Mycena floridula]|nr:hypothetical protein C8J56DRAFT_1029891 [Mycena floridula]